MQKILLFAVLATAVFTSCDTDEPVMPADPHAAFKADATLRWESGTTVEKHEDSGYTFITDEGGFLFGSDRHKIGRMSADGSTYEIIEFDGQPKVGVHDSPVLRTHEGTSDLHHLEIVQITDGKLWVVFRETPSSNERKVVQ